MNWLNARLITFHKGIILGLCTLYSFGDPREKVTYSVLNVKTIQILFAKMFLDVVYFAIGSPIDGTSID